MRILTHRGKKKKKTPYRESGISVHDYIVFVHNHHRGAGFCILQQEMEMMRYSELTRSER
jgi:hypothetical protein